MSKEAIDAITSAFSAEEVWELSTYRAYVPSGEVIVELSDSNVPGPHRYAAQAYDPNIPEHERGVNNNGHTTGNPDSTIKGAIHNLHTGIFKADQ